MSDALLTASLVTASALAFVGVFYSVWRRSATQSEEAQQQDRMLNQMYLKELDDALEDWLGMLQVPGLEEKTKRVAIARQLSTVLIEKLWRTRCPDRISTVDSQF